MGSSLVLAGALAAFGGLATASADDGGSHDATWAMDCSWMGIAGQPSIPRTTISVTLTAPGAIAPGQSADVVAKFKNGAVMVLPSTAKVTTYTGATLAFAVTGGSSVTQLALAGPTGSTPITSGGISETGELTAKLPIPDAGWRSLTVSKLTLSLGNDGATAVSVVCTPHSQESPSITVKAEASTPSPSASQSPSPGTTVLTQTVQAGVPGATITSPTATDTSGTSSTTAGSGTSSTTGGNLAHTGTGGAGLKALAMLAGTALLAAIAVLITTPARRRNKANGVS